MNQQIIIEHKYVGFFFNRPHSLLSIDYDLLWCYLGWEKLQYIY